MLTATTDRDPVPGCNCGCCVEVRDLRAAKRQVLFGCHCNAHPADERCDCAFCVTPTPLTAENITDDQVIEATAFDLRVRETNVQLIILREWAMTRGHVQRTAARARCAEILNQRASKEDK